MFPKLALNLWFVILLSALVDQINGHGRFIKPPSRASAWRYGFPTKPDYDDTASFCGGFERQWKTNGGKCGECGDAFDLKKPRPHEFGGEYGQGVITGKYKSGSEISMQVNLTAYHMGYFEFRVCDNINAEQFCLDKHLLKLIGGTPSNPKTTDLKTRFYPRFGSRVYEIRGQLPADFKCTHCVLQWRYVAGNNWGTCPDGTQARGCGPQEEFRACSDISIGDSEISKLSVQKPGMGGRFIIILTLLLVLYVLFANLLYPYHGQRVRQILGWNPYKHNVNHIQKGLLETRSNDGTSKIITVSLPTTPITMQCETSRADLV